jgi:integrase/recombinase XerD
VQYTEDVEGSLPKLAQFFRRKGITDQTIYQKFTCIKIFLKWSGFPSEYTFHISNKGKKEFKVKHAKRWFDKAEIQKCLDYEFQTGKNVVRDKLIVSLLIDTGCRAKELSYLKGVDIDLEDGSLFLSDSKTEPRPAFFSPHSKRLMEQLKERLCGQWDGYLFPKVDRIKFIVCNMLLDLGLKNGTDGRGPHTFRHYFASNLFFIGDMRIEDVALLMGDTADTVRNVYLHCPVEVLKEKTRKAMGW